MKAEEFDEFLFDPTGFYLRTYLPRVASAFEGFEGFEELPSFPGLHYFRLINAMRSFANQVGGVSRPHDDCQCARLGQPHRHDSGPLGARRVHVG